MISVFSSNVEPFKESLSKLGVKVFRYNFDHLTSFPNICHLKNYSINVFLGYHYCLAMSDLAKQMGYCIVRQGTFGIFYLTPTPTSTHCITRLIMVNSFQNFSEDELKAFNWLKSHIEMLDRIRLNASLPLENETSVTVENRTYKLKPSENGAFMRLLHCSKWDSK